MPLNFGFALGAWPSFSDWRTLAVSTSTKITNRQHFIAPKMIEYRPEDYLIEVCMVAPYTDSCLSPEKCGIK